MTDYHTHANVVLALSRDGESGRVSSLVKRLESMEGEKFFIYAGDTYIPKHVCNPLLDAKIRSIAVAPDSLSPEKASRFVPFVKGRVNLHPDAAPKFSVIVLDAADTWSYNYTSLYGHAFELAVEFDCTVILSSRGIKPEYRDHGDVIGGRLASAERCLHNQAKTIENAQKFREGIEGALGADLGKWTNDGIISAVRDKAKAYRRAYDILDMVRRKTKADSWDVIEDRLCHILGKVAHYDKAADTLSEIMGVSGASKWDMIVPTLDSFIDAREELIGILDLQKDATWATIQGAVAKAVSRYDNVNEAATSRAQLLDDIRTALGDPTVLWSRLAERARELKDTADQMKAAAKSQAESAEYRGAILTRIRDTLGTSGLFVCLPDLVENLKQQKAEADAALVEASKRVTKILADAEKLETSPLRLKPGTVFKFKKKPEFWFGDGWDEFMVSLPGAAADGHSEFKRVEASCLYSDTHGACEEDIIVYPHLEARPKAVSLIRLPPGTQFRFLKDSTRGKMSSARFGASEPGDTVFAAEDGIASNGGQAFSKLYHRFLWNTNGLTRDDQIELVFPTHLEA